MFRHSVYKRKYTNGQLQSEKLSVTEFDITPTNDRDIIAKFINFMDSPKIAYLYVYLLLYSIYNFQIYIQ